MSARATDHATRWVTGREAAQIIGFSEAHLARLRMQGGGPPFAKLGTGKQAHVRYSTADLDAWMRAHVVASTSQGAV